MNKPNPTCTASFRDTTNSQADLSMLSGRTSDRYNQARDYNDESMYKDQSKFLRELNVENMKLTEEIIKQNLDQTSSIEKISNDRSKLFLLLSEQKIHNKKLLEQNQTLMAQVGLQNKSRSLSPGGINLNCNRGMNSYRQDPPSNLQLNNLDLLLNGDDDIHSPQKSQFSSPVCNHSRVRSTLAPNFSQGTLQTSSQILQPNFSTSRSHALVTDSINLAIDNHRLSDISLLQNHITLLEKENEILKRELTSMKQQESHATLSIRELQLEIKDLNTTKNTLNKEKEELRSFLKERTEEANKTITKLAQINQDLTLKANTYQIAVDKLSAELYNITKSAPRNEGLVARNSNKENSHHHNDSFNKELKNSDLDDKSKEEIIICRKENFKLKADLKALSERIESLRKDNEDLVNQRRQEMESQQRNTLILDSTSNWSMIDPQSAKHIRNGSQDFTQKMNLCNNINMFRSPEVTTRSMINASLGHYHPTDRSSIASIK